MAKKVKSGAVAQTKERHKRRLTNPSQIFW